MGLLLLFVVVGLVCSFVGVAIAGDKGRSTGEGFALGCLFSLPGVIIEACLPARRAVAKTAPASLHVADELLKLADLRDRAVITPGEFTAMKARLLAGTGPFVAEAAPAVDQDMEAYLGAQVRINTAVPRAADWWRSLNLAERLSFVIVVPLVLAAGITFFVVTSR